MSPAKIDALHRGEFGSIVSANSDTCRNYGSGKEATESARRIATAVALVLSLLTLALGITMRVQSP